MARRHPVLWLLGGMAAIVVVVVYHHQEGQSRTVLLGDGLDAQGHWLGWAGGNEAKSSLGYSRRGREGARVGEGRTEADMDVGIAGQQLPDVLRRGWQAVWNRVRGVNCDEACMTDLYKRWAYSKARATHAIQREVPPPPPTTQDYEITQ
eukprot:1122102-Rhodomonas_salina.2